MFGRIKRVVLGSARDVADKSVFHRLSLIAFFAWVGLGADGLSSSCYGPQDAFVALQAHPYLGFFVAIGTAVTVLVISYSYSQIIELFPTGGGGYLVASKLLSPSVGMVSGCALLVDYVLTIAISVASGADALLSSSFIPPHWQAYKMQLALAGVVVLLVLNLRGVRESVVPLVPIFVVFVLTHVAGILYACLSHAPNVGAVAQSTADDLSRARGELGLLGMVILILRAYSMGAGTFTGIEAVSNGLPILREPRAQTGKRTMAYMAISLAFTAGGLMVAYILHHVSPVFGANGLVVKTSNAVLFETITSGWGNGGQVLVLITLFSEAALLFVAAQAGFLDGPRVLSNMSLDRWMPGRLSLLSDRLVTAYGIVLMGLAALLMVLVTGADVAVLVVLYSINVFITFVLSQTGMVRHWWLVRKEVRGWVKKLLINGMGLVLCAFILVSMTVLKFHEGGWITLLGTGGLVLVAALIRRHYNKVRAMLSRLDGLVQGAKAEMARAAAQPAAPVPQAAPAGEVAVLLVNGFNGLGLHSLLAMIRLFGKNFGRFIFVQVGVVDAGTFKGSEELQQLHRHVQEELELYVRYMQLNGYPASARSSVGVDMVEEIIRLSREIRQEHPGAVFFGGQLVFTNDSIVNRLLHNNIAFAVQRRLYLEGVPLVVLPIRV